MPAPYTVELRQGDTRGTVTGTLTDALGFVVRVTATRGEDGVYRGTGELEPGMWRVPGLDDDLGATEKQG